MEKLAPIFMAFTLGTLLSAGISLVIIYRERLLNSLLNLIGKKSSFDESFHALVFRKKAALFHFSSNQIFTIKRRKELKKTKQICQNPEDVESVRVLIKNGNYDQRIYKFFQDLMSENESEMDVFVKSIKNLSGVAISPQFLLCVGKKMLYTGQFLKKGNEVTFSYSEIKNRFFSLTALIFLLDDVQHRQGAFIKQLCSKIKKDEKSLYQAIDYIFSLKSGGNKEHLLKTYAAQKEVKNLRLDSYDFERKFNLSVSVIRQSDLSFLYISQWIDLIKKSSIEIENKRAKIQEEKIHQENKKKQKKKVEKKATLWDSPKVQHSFVILNMQPSQNILEIKKSYKKQVMLFHPDKRIQENMGQTQISRINHEFFEIQDAYQFLLKMAQ